MGDQATVRRTETVPIESVRPHPRNARKGDARRIERSLRAHGQYKPIVVHEETGHVLVGNNTWRIAREKLGWDKIHATFVSCTDAKALEILAVDNRTSDGATYDNGALLELLDDISKSGSLAAAGYGTNDHAALIARLETAPTLSLTPRAPAETPRLKVVARDLHPARHVTVTLKDQDFTDFAAHLDRLGEHFGTDTDAETVIAAVTHVSTVLMEGAP
jgi:ParB-like chromosome segregation protein Spo0J